jgi:hypothetical protein
VTSIEVEVTQRDQIIAPGTLAVRPIGEPSGDLLCSSARFSPSTPTTAARSQQKGAHNDGRASFLNEKETLVTLALMPRGLVLLTALLAALTLTTLATADDSIPTVDVRPIVGTVFKTTCDFTAKITKGGRNHQPGLRAA